MPVTVLSGESVNWANHRRVRRWHGDSESR